MRKQKQSKYLNKEIGNGWVVTACKVEKSNHRRFTLIGPEYKNIRGTFREQIIVWDRELNKIVKGEVTIKSIRDKKIDTWLDSLKKNKVELDCYDIICVKAEPTTVKKSSQNKKVA